MCGLSRQEDIIAANELMPEYIGFVFWEKSRRYVTDETARELKGQLDKRIKAVGVFLDDEMEHIVSLAKAGTIDLIQLHGHEGGAYIDRLRTYTDKPIIQAFLVHDRDDLMRAESSKADYILLDAGTGSGETFDWNILSGGSRPYFLAGGLNPENAAGAVTLLHPYAVDVSSGIETDGHKNPEKMRAFAESVGQVEACLMGK